MKKGIAFITTILLGTLSYAQLEISASTGYAMGSAGMKLGEKVSTTETDNVYGSYGEGLNTQIRGTYFFNDTFGVDIGIGYLQGADQTISYINTPNTELDAIARARAFGASTSIVYKFTNAIYGRFGALLKLGGKTEAVVSQKTVFSDAEATGLGIPEGSYSMTNYKEDYHGKFPIGFAGALGYTYPLNTHLSLFVEAEYYGISLKRKDSELA